MRASLAVLVAFSLGCGRIGANSGQQPFKPTRGVVLISIDTLRADHLSGYGYDRPTSPFLDSLAQRGVRFERVFAQMPNTLTSHMTALTGLYPAEHGVYPPDGVLSPQIPILAELFHQAGYRTGGVTEAGYMKGGYGFSRGFDSFSDQWPDRSPDADHIKNRRLQSTLAQGLAFLRSIGAGQRFFLFLHTYAVHAPYDPPQPYDGMFWKRPAPDVFVPTGANLDRFNKVGGELPAGALDYFRALYDGEIRYTDDQLKAFFSQLDGLGLGTDLTIVIMSDHGEEFLEHGILEHSQLYRETLHVPLIVVHPQLHRGLEVGEPVELVDLTPTLCALARLHCPDGLSGRSLARELRGKGPPHPDAYAYSEMNKGAERTLIWSDGGRRYQLVDTAVGQNAWLGRHFSFDLPVGRDSFEIKSFQTPRQAEMIVDGEDVRTLDLTPRWQVVRVGEQVGRRRRRVTVRSDHCTELHVKLGRVRCLAFSIRRPQPERIELFDMIDDPAETQDVSRRQPAIVSRLLRELKHYESGPRAPAGHLKITGRHKRRLKALGYLD